MFCSKVFVVAVIVLFFIFLSFYQSTKIIQVTALDGDKGVPNTVSYSFIQGDEGYFDIEADTGWITVKTQLDRDTSDVTQKGGAFAIYVKVRLTEYLQLQNSKLRFHLTSTYIQLSIYTRTFS